MNNKKRFIPINRPDFNNQDIELYLKYKYGKYGEYNKIKELEKRFAEYLGGDYYTIFTASAKMSLYLLLKFLNLKGKVASTPLTCFAALSPIFANKISIQYSDINGKTFNLDPSLIINGQDKSIGAIILNYFGGSPFDISDIIDYAKRNSITIIEDCAQSLGAEINSFPLGSFGDHSFFSFTKHFSLVGGGLLASKDKNLIDKIRKYQNELPSVPTGLLDYRLKRDIIEKYVGDDTFTKSYIDNFLSEKKSYEEKDPLSTFSSDSVLCKPSNLQAAVILSQFERLANLIDRRRKNVNLLSRKLHKIKDVKPQEIIGKSAYSKYYIKTNKQNKKIITYLNEKGIDAKQLTKSHGFYMQPSIDKTSYYNDVSIENCQNYKSIFDHILELPLSSNMTNNELDIIAEHIKRSAR